MKRIRRTLSSLSGWLLQPVLVLGILVVGFVAASRLSLRREPPQRAEAPVYAPLVRAMETSRRPYTVEIRGNGTLQARTSIKLVPQVGGQVLEIHPGLRAGGRFRAGEVLLRIEPLDYELSVSRADAEVSSAETAVITIEAESEASVEEWNQLHPDEPCPPLVSMEPQLREAQARVQAARAELENARLDLSRTRVALPFDGRVVEASVDRGEVVAANQPLGIVYATDVFEVAVPLRVEELGWLELPDHGPSELGSPAVVSGEAVGGALEVDGYIARVFGELDGKSRMARVVVEVQTADVDPDVLLRLLPGTFVDVALGGRTLEGVVELPRSAVRAGGVVWTVVDGRLSFAHPRILRGANGSVLVEGLEPRARVVTSNLEIVTDGMQVRVLEEDQAQ